MAQRDGPAVGVDARRVKVQRAGDGEGLGGKGLVRFDQVEILRLQPQLPAQGLHGRDRAEAHDFRVHPGQRIAHHPCPAALVTARQDQRRPAVIDARSVARRHRAVLLEDGLETGQRLKARGLGVFIGVEDRGTFATPDLDRDDLVLEAPFGKRPGGAGLAFQRKGVLIGAGDAMGCGDVFRRHAHVASAEGAGQRARHHVERPGVAHLLAKARGGQDVG